METRAACLPHAWWDPTLKLHTNGFGWSSSTAPTGSLAPLSPLVAGTSARRRVGAPLVKESLPAGGPGSKGPGHPRTSSLAPLLSEHPPGACWAWGHSRDRLMASPCPPDQVSLPGSSRTSRPPPLSASGTGGPIQPGLCELPSVDNAHGYASTLLSAPTPGQRSRGLRVAFAQIGVQRRPSSFARPLTDACSSAFLCRQLAPRSSAASPALTSQAGPDPPCLHNLPGPQRPAAVPATRVPTYTS